MKYSGSVSDLHFPIDFLCQLLGCFSPYCVRLTGHSIQVDDDVSQEDIKAAYRQAAKFCHPDVNDAGHELCILLNEV